MSSSSPQSFRTQYLRPALPVFTSLLNLLGIGGGLYNFSSATGGAAGFGIILPANPSAIETAYARIHGIRNFGTGLGGLAMIMYLQFSSLTKHSPAAANAVRKIIGLSLICGTTVALGDGWILDQLASTAKVEGVVDLAAMKSVQHSFMAVPIAVLGVAWLLV